MGTLTMRAAPVSTYSHKDREFEINGTTLKIPQVGQTEINKMVSELSTRYDVDEADRLIMEKFGADYLIPKELYDMSIEIVNTDFRTDTDAVLSFTIQSNGSREFAPSYDDIC